MYKLFLLLSVFIISNIGYAEEPPTTKIYPPYPEVWGYDISEFPAINNGCASVDAYRMPDGDIWFLIDYDFKYKDPMKGSLGGYTDEKFILLKFFKGEQTELNAQEREDLSKVMPRRSGRMSYEMINFSDGSSLKFDNRSGASRCLGPEFIENYYLKTDKNNKEKKYSILVATPHVKIHEDEELCEVKGGPFFYQKLRLLTSLIDLEDDTFIAYESGANLILRFDKDFNTKFKPVNPVSINTGEIISRNFFVIEYSVIEELEKKVSQDRGVPFYQGVHDELLLYFKNKYH